MIPDPTTATRRKAVPHASPAIRRGRSTRWGAGSTTTGTPCALTTRSFAPRRHFTHRRAAGSSAAVLGEVSDKTVHPGVVRRVDQLPTPPLLGDQPRMHEVVEVKGERGGRDVQGVGDGPGGKAPRPAADEQPKDGQPRLLGQRAQPRQDVPGLHGTTFLEDSKRSRKTRRSLSNGRRSGGRCCSGGRGVSGEGVDAPGPPPPPGPRPP